MIWATYGKRHRLLIRLGVTLSALLIILPSAWADCEQRLTSELTRPPDDIRNGLVTDRVGLSVPAILFAYSRGLFPWGAAANGNVRWHRPPARGVLNFSELHIGRSDRKYLRQALESGELRVTFDEDFRQVVEQCATVPRFHHSSSGDVKIPESTWITPAFIDAYEDLHKQGLAHSVEVWRGDRLVGGLYGVFINGVFTGESMFHLEPDVTKLAFYALIERLQARGHDFIDTQMAIGLSGKWGARLIPRPIFEAKLRRAQARKLKF